MLVRRKNLVIAISVLLALETPASTAQITFVSHSLGSNIWTATGIGTGDVDGDGDIDALSRRDSYGVHMLINNSAAAPPLFKRHIVWGGGQDVEFRVEDMDGDGDNDIISSTSSIHPCFFDNDGASLPTFTRSFPILERGAPEIEDMDGDGDYDVVLGNWRGSIYFAENHGVSPLSFTVHPVAPDIGSACRATIADVDSDGDPDIIAAFIVANAVRWYENNGAQPLAFSAHDISVGPEAVLASRAYGADMNGDGDTDVIHATATGAVWIHLNNGDKPPTFTTSLLHDAGGSLRAMAIGDIDNDGHLDVVVSSTGAIEIAWLRNDGQLAPAFISEVVHLTSNAHNLALADLDGDGDLDVLTPWRWFQNTVPCPWDLDSDGAIGSSDLAQLVGTWGQYGVPANFAGAAVGADDLAELIGRWGPCP